MLLIKQCSRHERFNYSTSAICEQTHWLFSTMNKKNTFYLTETFLGTDFKAVIGDSFQWTSTGFTGVYKSWCPSFYLCFCRFVQSPAFLGGCPSYPFLLEWWAKNQNEDEDKDEDDDNNNNDNDNNHNQKVFLFCLIICLCFCCCEKSLKKFHNYIYIYIWMYIYIFFFYLLYIFTMGDFFNKREYSGTDCLDLILQYLCGFYKNNKLHIHIYWQLNISLGTQIIHIYLIYNTIIISQFKLMP